ncbi:cbb3-type cytochrome c oxidase N-terminal domain-containing protein [Fulvivirgaceae bacterium BMA10]|uniref:Cbb3-type cytochrome c oxidase N-terminal domain-containing protein n=1 Tax=Splendidivirga corallicola TaxID=3051826 RepID=A0ABT8KWD9_9BACT|nr:cbb3-type cytochrome c oxidase N-terminal domain-containing protein [Fulvivirgaceae bacterium BMA10]
MKSSIKNIFSHKQAWLLLVMLIFPLMGFAQEATESEQSIWTNEFVFYTVVGMVIVVALLTLAVAYYVLQVVKLIILREKEQKAIEEGVELAPEPSLWQRMMHKLTDSVPVEKEETVMLDHDYDGIKELDNHLPPWWTALFYVTIIFGVVYILAYHVFDTLPLQEEEYNTQMKVAAAKIEERKAEQGGDVIDENTVVFTDNASNLDTGKKIFDGQCAACHRTDGGGGVGPNLTDDYWLHGGSINDIFKTIKYGVPDKGMISWEAILSPAQMSDVSSYIVTLKGTNPPDPKAPQGDLYQEE